MGVGQTPPSTGGNGKDSSSGSEPSAERLALEKLALEVDALRLKTKLEVTKLQDDIRELETAPNRATRTQWLAFASTALTALITVAIFVAGFKFNATVQRHLDEQRASDSYNALLLNLGSPNAAARAGAVQGLLSIITKTPSDERAGYAITMLTTRLANEEDPSVQQVLIVALKQVGQPALEGTINANRVAGARFQDAVARYIGLRIDPRTNLAPLSWQYISNMFSAQQWQVINAGLGALPPTDYNAYIYAGTFYADEEKRALLHILLPTYPTAKALREFAQWITPSIDEAIQPLADSTAYTRRIDVSILNSDAADAAAREFAAIFLSRLPQTPKLIRAGMDEQTVLSNGHADIIAARRSALHDIKQAASAVFASSLVLEYFMQNALPAASPPPFDDVVLVHVDLHNANLRNLTFERAWIEGSAQGADLGASDFRFAHIEHLELRKAHVANDANFFGTYLSEGAKSDIGLQKFKQSALGFRERFMKNNAVASSRRYSNGS